MQPGATGLPSTALDELLHRPPWQARAACRDDPLEAGESMKVVQERLGHASMAITADVYSHVRREVDQAAARRVAAVIFGS